MKVVLVTKHPRQEEREKHEQSVRAVRNSLESLGLDYGYIHRENLQSDLKNDVDWFVTVGGDGTVLETSHFAVEQPILGVNSNPTSSVGSLCVANSHDFKTVLQECLTGTLRATRVSRIQMNLNGKALKCLALNDLLVANANPAALTRCWLDTNQGEVLHKNSGLWISTACGSTAALVSSGGCVQSIEDRRIQWICREPFYAERKAPSGLHGFLEPGQILTIRSQMAEGRIYIDGSHRSEPFPEGAILRLTLSDSDLNLVMTPAMELRRQGLGRWRERNEIERRHESTAICRTGDAQK
ncbi:MAG: NAD(+)/NADH kinase [Myxococcaceae bacterium]|nr:NAD(+)/NADH kinase [Myxococcaceae bacterium]MBH2006553.1 NAD(+)/NADH kinase [Myxococcaceae bacterium]